MAGKSDPRSSASLVAARHGLQKKPTRLRRVAALAGPTCRLHAKDKFRLSWSVFAGSRGWFFCIVVSLWDRYLVKSQRWMQFHPPSQGQDVIKEPGKLIWNSISALPRQRTRHQISSLRQIRLQIIKSFSDKRTFSIFLFPPLDMDHKMLPRWDYGILTSSMQLPHQARREGRGPAKKHVSIYEASCLLYITGRACRTYLDLSCSQSQESTSRKGCVRPFRMKVCDKISWH